MFARTTALAIFKKKATSKKQKKKAQSIRSEVGMSLKVQHIKDVKSGIRRRSVMRHDDPVTLAIRSVST